MNRSTLKLTSGQLERDLSQRIQALYRTQMEHQPEQVTCQIFENKVAIVLKNSITRPVKLLAEQGKQNVAQRLWSNLDDAIQPQLKQLIEEVLGVSVIDWLTDSTIETGWTGTIAVLAATPPAINSDTP